MEKLVLIDGNSLVNRAFYAMPLLTTKDGTYTNAVYGFMNMFFKILDEDKPQYLAVAFDLKAPTFRHKMYTEYKGTRKPMPEELRPQIPLLKEILRLMDVAVVEKEGIEADDVIGTIAKHTDVYTLIFTGDRDSFQLVDESTEVRFTRRGITEVESYTAANFEEKTGISPKQIIDLKSLMGDSSDNIPGVSGVGEKTALDLIKKYSSLDGVYEHIDEIKGKLSEKLKEDEEKARLSYTLATIKTDCDVLTDLEKMRVKTPFSEKLREKFRELEFKSLFLREELFAQNAEPVKTEEKVETVELSGEKLPDEILSAERLAVCISNGKISLSDGKTEFFYKTVSDNILDYGESPKAVLERLKPVFTGKIPLIVFDKKEFMHYLKDVADITLKAKTDDASLIKYLVDYSGKAESLTDVVADYGYDPKALALAVFKIYKNLYPKLKQEEMDELYENVELPLSEVLFSMESDGFKVDYDEISRAGEKYSEILKDYESQIREISGEKDLNVNSPRQLGEVLFEKLKIGKGKKTKTGYSTSAEVLESFEDAHPVVPLILKYRKIQKLSSTYVEGFKPLIDRKTGIIHTSFNQTVTSTGRLSSKEPNLQNIPVRDEEGKELRKFFVPRSENGLLISADYSQIELRLLAAFSGCDALIKAFNSGADIHAATAAKVFGVKLSEVTPSQRSSAKAVNFGIIYGISEYGLAKNLKISPVKARGYIDAYFKEYPEVKEYMNKNVAFTSKTGYAVTVLKRRRYIREIYSANYNLRQFGERAAMNMPLQGSSADIIKLAMIGVYDRLKKEGLKAKLILQIHDELIVDAPSYEKEKVEKILREEMEGAIKLSVPLTVSVGVGKNWYEAK